MNRNGEPAFRDMPNQGGGEMRTMVSRNVHGTNDRAPGKASRHPAYMPAGDGIVETNGFSSHVR